MSQPRDVADQNLGDGIIDKIGQVEALFGGFGRQQIQGLFDAGVQLEGMPLQFEFARFDFGEIQDVIDDG